MEQFFEILNTTLRPLIILICAVAAAYVVTFIAKRAAAQIISRSVKGNRFHKMTHKEEEQREGTLNSVIGTAITAVVWAMAILVILGGFGINVAPLIAGAGVIGLAVSFGAQSLIKDCFAGIFILLENQYRVGDVVQLNETTSGVVERISLRLTTLRDLAGQTHHIPNGNITIATNMTMEYAQVDMNVSVSYATDIDKLERVINKVGAKLAEEDDWKDRILEPAKMLRVDSFEASSIAVKVICKTTASQQWDVKGELLRRLKVAFEKESIEIPLPQRVVHNTDQPAKK